MEKAGGISFYWAVSCGCAFRQFCNKDCKIVKTMIDYQKVHIEHFLRIGMGISQRYQAAVE